MMFDVFSLDKDSYEDLQEFLKKNEHLHIQSVDKTEKNTTVTFNTGASLSYVNLKRSKND